MAESTFSRSTVPRGTHGRRGRFGVLLAALIAVLTAVLLGSGAFAPSAHAATGVETVAAQLKQQPVYVDPRASGELSPSQADALASKIERADKPIFVAVLPAAPQFPQATVLQDLRSAVGITGVYAVQLGDRFDAGADAQVMPRNAVDNLVGQVQRSSGGDTAAELNSFVDSAARQANGQAPEQWPGGAAAPGVSGAAAAVTLGAVVLLVVGGGYILFRRGRAARREREQAQLDKLRTVVDEDITTYGEELDRLDYSPAAEHPGGEAAEAQRRDYARALDAYEEAKALMASARRPPDVTPVTKALEGGRFALSTLAARRAGKPLPERRPPCFFDPRHGPSVQDVLWAPPDGVRREVPACAADTARISDGQEPMYRKVATASGPEPYWNAGPAYGPWAGGYFGGGLLPGLLIGTLLGGAFLDPAYGYDGSYDGSYGGDSAGGDASGSDFDSGDFGGGGGFGGGDGGGFGGGDFGGGF